MKKLVTHNGKFHTDDVLAYAILLKYFKGKNEEVSIIRTRDQEVINSGDIVFDVGSIYDSTTHRYDHHQVGRAGERENSIPYAACGLVWKHFGKELCSNQEVWNSVDESLVQGIDAIDNGVSLFSLNVLHVKPFTIGNVVNCFLPSNEEASLEEFDQGFLKAGEFLLFILENTISQSERIIQDKKNAELVYNKSDDKQIILCEKYIPGIKKLLSIFPEPIYTIYPDQNGNWRIEGIRIDSNDFPIRKNLPESWAGLRDENFQKASEVSDATFCHPGLFTAGAKTKEGALALAKKALAV